MVTKSGGVALRDEEIRGGEGEMGTGWGAAPLWAVVRGN